MTDDFLANFEAKRAAREAADRSFVIAGETLRFRPSIAPEVAFKFRASQVSAMEDLEKLQAWSAEYAAAAAKNGKGEADMAKLIERVPEPRLSDDDLLLVADETVLACLEPDTHEAWARLRSPEAPQPITYDEVFEIVGYLLSRVTQIPTDAPSDSSAGRTQDDKRSTGKSSSPAKTPTVSA